MSGPSKWTLNKIHNFNQGLKSHSELGFRFPARKMCWCLANLIDRVLKEPTRRKELERRRRRRLKDERKEEAITLSCLVEILAAMMWTSLSLVSLMCTREASHWRSLEFANQVETTTRSLMYSCLCHRNLCEFFDIVAHQVEASLELPQFVVVMTKVVNVIEVDLVVVFKQVLWTLAYLVSWSGFVLVSRCN